MATIKQLTFWDGFAGVQAQIAKMNGAEMMAFNWDLAAEIIKQRFVQHPDLIAEAGLQGDWSYTGGCIFAEGEAIISEYTYLSSNWAIPTLILSWDGDEQESIECYCEADDRFNSDSKWDEESLKILGRNIKLLSE